MISNASSFFCYFLDFFSLIIDFASVCAAQLCLYVKEFLFDFSTIVFRKAFFGICSLELFGKGRTVTAKIQQKSDVWVTFWTDKHRPLQNGLKIDCPSAQKFESSFFGEFVLPAKSNKLNFCLTGGFTEFW